MVSPATAATAEASPSWRLGAAEEKGAALVCAELFIATKELRSAKRIQGYKLDQ